MTDTAHQSMVIKRGPIKPLEPFDPILGLFLSMTWLFIYHLKKKKKESPLKPHQSLNKSVLNANLNKNKNQETGKKKKRLGKIL